MKDKTILFLLSALVGFVLVWFYVEVRRNL